MNRTGIYLMITLTIMFICSSCTSNLLENDLKEAELKGKVKSIKTIEYKAVEKFGELVKDKCEKTTLRLYNQEGNILEKREYFSDGSLYYKFICSYDTKGKLIDKTYKDDKYSRKIKYTYDKNENMIEKSTYDENGDILGKAEFSYDKNGNMIESSLSGLEGREKAKYSYDKNGNKIEKNSYDENGELSGRVKYSYDSKGIIIEISEYGPAGKLFYRIKYRYDPSGNMTEEYTDYGYNEYLGDQSYTYRRYNYDKKGNKIEYSIKMDGSEEGKLSYDSKGNLIKKSIRGSECDNDYYSEIEYSYDKKGNMIEKNESGYFGENYCEKTTYCYDKKGNWIQRVMYSNSGRHSDQRCEITEREIEYY